MKKSVVFILHIIYWMLYSCIILIIIKLIRESAGFMNPTWFNIFVSSSLIPAILGFYASYTFLFPRFLKRKKILSLFLYGLPIYFVCALIQDLYLTITPGPGVFVEQWNSAIGITLTLTIFALIHGVMGLIMRGFVTWYGDIKLKEDLNKKNYEMELALVKSQINPHFLFNTINNIDVLIEKDAAKASAYLNKLSDIMRFMLYETKTEKISLEKELTYIEKYVDLQKIRTSNTDFVHYSVEGNPAHSMIAPMLFIPFIENAFKHADDKKSKNSINIKVIIENEKIIFDCENNYSSIIQSKLDQSGLGNELIKKRLTLLYPNNHTLDVTDTDGIYKVKLTLLKNEH